jgi:hypothetical protein
LSRRGVWLGCRCRGSAQSKCLGAPTSRGINGTPMMPKGARRPACGPRLPLASALRWTGFPEAGAERDLCGCAAVAAGRPLPPRHAAHRLECRHRAAAPNPTSIARHLSLGSKWRPCRWFFVAKTKTRALQLRIWTFEPSWTARWSRSPSDPPHRPASRLAPQRQMLGGAAFVFAIGSAG